MARPDIQAVFEASPNPYMILDRDLRYVAANPAYLRVTNTPSVDRLLGHHVLELFPNDPSNPNDAQARRLVDSLQRVLDAGEPDVLAFIPYRIPTGKGGVEERFWSATHLPLRDEKGNVAFVLQHTVDVTELHRLRQGAGRDEAGVLARAASVEREKEALTSRLAHLRGIFDQAPGFSAFLSGPDFVFELANAAYQTLIGRTDIVGKPLAQALPEIAGQGYVELLQEVARTGRPFVGRAMEVSLQRKTDGPPDRVVVDFVYQPVLEGDRVIGIFVQGNDVTEQQRLAKEREQLLAETQHARAELEAIFESFPEAVYAGDEHGIRRVNRAAVELLGYDTRDDLLRGLVVLLEQSEARFLDGGRYELKDSPFSHALQGRSTRVEVAIRNRKTNDERILRSTGAPVRIGGQTVGAVVTHMDITESKRVENEILQLANVLDATKDFVAISDLQGNATFLNTGALELMGLPDLPTARRLPVLEYFVEEERAQVRDEVLPTALREGYWTGELHFRHQRSGASIPVLFSVFPLRGADGRITALATITRDLRMQKVAEAERARLLESEQMLRAQAELASRLKDEFLATVSHELRTPLTSMLGWLQMLRAGMLTEEKRARALDTVERNARSQAQLIEDLLDVSRIVSGKLALERAPLELSQVVTAAVETVRPTAEVKNVELSVSLGDGAMVMGDATRLQQVVWNLLTNAVKFTPPEGRVRVVLRHDAERTTLEVTDNGIGIAPDFLAHVFERFRQADASPTRRTGGLGLGLSIVRHLVEAHGGVVEATSEGEGQGSTFRVHLPLLGPGKAAPPRVRTGPWQEARAIDPPRAIAGLRVLLVDDEQDTREYVRALLQRCEATVIEAKSAREGLEALRRERPDVLISDIGMPHEDGYRLIQQIRALPDDGGGKTPAIALTAYARLEDRTRAMLAGFQNHVTKPIEASELLAVIASLASQLRPT